MRRANRTQIPVGREHSISRERLARLWGISERDTRRMVAKLRAEAGDDGYAILSTSRRPSGYWRSNDPEEIRGFIHETEARARNTFAAIRDAKRVLRRLVNAERYPRRLDGEGR